MGSGGELGAHGQHAFIRAAPSVWRARADLRAGVRDSDAGTRCAQAYTAAVFARPWLPRAWRGPAT
jgi:hypothetical protein